MVATPWMRTVTRLERSLSAGAVFFSEALYTAKHPHLKGATIWRRTQPMGAPFGSVLAAGINDNLRLAALTLQTGPLRTDYLPQSSSMRTQRLIRIEGNNSSRPRSMRKGR